jgi:glycosyltransferase involved in cell wall biosynthesis
MTVTRTLSDVYVACQGDLNGWGGAMIAGRGLAAACRRAGFSTLLLGVGDRQPKPPVTTEGNKLQNISVRPLPLLWRVHTWCVPWGLARQLSRMPSPHVAFVSFCPFWTVAAKRTWPDLPVVFRFCGLLSNCGPLTRPRDRKVTFWKYVADAGTRAAERQALRVADRILVPTREHVEEIVAFQPEARGRLRVSPDGCDRFELRDEDRQALRARLGLSDTDFLVLLCGSCDRNKSFDHALRDLARTDPRAKLAIIGDGPDRRKLQTLTHEMKLAHRVHLLGRVPDIAGWYAAADCVVSTSVYDTFPNVIKEAMWCGRPVVVPRHDPPRVYAGISGLLSREGGGLTYDRQTPGALADRLNALIANERRAAALGMRGHEVATELFRWDDTVTQIWSVAGLSPPVPTPSAVAAMATPSARQTRSVLPARSAPSETRGRAESEACAPCPVASMAGSPDVRVMPVSCDSAPANRH